MKKNLFLCIGSLVLLVVGIILLINSPKLGDSYTHSLLFKYNSSVDTAKYHIVLENSIKNYRILGALLSLFGWIGFIVSYILKKLDK